MRGVGGSFASLKSCSTPRPADDRPPGRVALRAAREADLDQIATIWNYEVLCTVPENRLAAFVAAAKATGVEATAIGVIREGTAPPRFVAAGGRAVTLERGSYSHF